MRKVDIIQTKSIAVIIANAKIPNWRKWLLSKLIPRELYELPPQKLAKLQRGEVITSMIIESFTPDCSDIGYAPKKTRRLTKNKQ